MSGGGGGGGQMPMASNRGQQQQQQQMGQMAPRAGWMPQDAGGGRGSIQDQRMMGGNQITPQNPMALFTPQVYQQPFDMGAMPMQTNQPPGMMGGQIAPMQVGQQVGGGMASMPKFANQQAYDDFMAQGGMQGMQDRMSGIGGLLGGQMPQQGMTKQQYLEMYGSGFKPGMTMIDDSGMGRGPSFPAPSPYAYDDPRNPRYGMIDVGRGFPGGTPLVQNPGPGRSYPINDVPMMPPRGGYPAPTNTTMPLPRRGSDGVGDGTGPGGMGFGFPRNMPPDPRLGFDDFRKGDLPGRGMPPSYGPTKGPIDGRKLRDMIDIRTRRPVDALPNALENNLPPSLKRPTQNRRG